MKINKQKAGEMIRNIKPLGLALIAVLAMSAMVASAASAASYHSVAAPTTVTGEQEGTNVFTVPGAGTVECKTATFHSNQTTTTTEDLTIHPSYGSCVAFGFANTHITTTGCDYTFTAPSGAGPYTAAVDVVCGAGSSIRITPTSFGFSVCTVTVGSQTTSGVADLTNNVGGTVSVNSTVTGIKHSAGCGASEASDGTYTGKVLTKGSAGAISVG